MTQNINVQKIEESLKLVKGKESKIFILTQDSKGNPKASITYNYELVKCLNEWYLLGKIISPVGVHATKLE